MKKVVLALLSILLLVGCSTNKSEQISSVISTTSNDINTSVIEEKSMNLYIDDQKLNVNWEDNDSVKELKGILPLTINMHEYGGFEQTGQIGQSIIRNDEQIDVIPGDIVLYNGNQISVFYANSSWSYTRLGHIDLNDNELNALLNKDAVTFLLKSE